MAYTRLETISWGSSPNITGSIAYDYQRSGADMQYKVKMTIDTLPYSDSRFGYPIYATIKLDGTTRISGHRIKAASPSVWSEALVYETGWLTVNEKSSGNTALDVNIYSGSGESRDKTYSYSLYVVPAASTMSFGTFTMGSAGTITVSRASSKYTHTITYRIGNASGTIATKSSSTSISWNPSIELARQITNATYATGVLCIDTYNGSTKIAGKEYNFTLYVPSSVKPSATLAVSLVNSNSTINGWGVCVKGYSKLSYTVTASGAYGASIASGQFTFAGKTVTGLSGTVDVSAAGNFTPSIKVTDSRGRSVTVKGDSITVYDYNPPSIAQLVVQRCEENGAARNDGTYVRVQGTFNVSGSVGGRNSVTAKCRYRAVNGSWSGYTTIQNSRAVIGGSMLATKTYQVEIVATDSVGEKKSVTVTVPTAEVAFHLRDGGKGAAFGKYAEKDALECAWNAEFGGDVSVGGKLSVGSGSIGNNGYVTGTWLRSTSHTDLGAMPTSYPVFSNGWLYSRTLAEMRADLGAYESVSVTVMSGRLNNLNYTARYYPLLGMCFLRVYGTLAVGMNQGYDYDLIKVGSREPSANTALAVKCNRKINAVIKSNGIVSLRPHDDGVNGYDVYISGWWTV